MPLDQHPLNRPSSPWVARRSTKKAQIRDVVVQHEQHRTSCGRKGRDGPLMSIYHLVSDAVMDAVCGQVFRGRLSLNRITEEDILGVVRERPVCQGTAPAAIEFKTATKDTARVKP